jgi:hypothetical protein
MMMDNLDNYLAREMKKWTVEYCPSPVGRQRLVHAASLPVQEAYWQFHSYCSKLFTNQLTDPISGEKYPLPYSQTNFWYLQLSTASQLR